MIEFKTLDIDDRNISKTKYQKELRLLKVDDWAIVQVFLPKSNISTNYPFECWCYSKVRVNAINSDRSITLVGNAFNLPGRCWEFIDGVMVSPIDRNFEFTGNVFPVRIVPVIDSITPRQGAFDRYCVWASQPVYEPLFVGERVYLSQKSFLESEISNLLRKEEKSLRSKFRCYSFNADEKIFVVFPFKEQLGKHKDFKQYLQESDYLSFNYLYSEKIK